MKPIPIPVRPFGPGSQSHEDVEFDYMPMPREMSVFAMPSVPEHFSRSDMAAACTTLDRFLEAFAAARANGHGHRVDLRDLAPNALDALNQSLGEGEVSVRISGEREIRIQETVFAGVWRERHHDESGAVVQDFLEASPIPSTALEAARSAAQPKVPRVDIPAAAMNAPALLAEIGAQVARFRSQSDAHVVNLTLLPMTPDDHGCLDRALAVGPVAIISRGFGNCRITSTSVRNVWRVQYFNNMQTLILNTIEVVAVPEVAVAADEDLADSEERLGELLAWMRESA